MTAPSVERGGVFTQALKLNNDIRMTDFKQAYDNIRNGERVTVRDEIMRLNGWKHKQQFTMAKNGTRPPTENQAKKIRKVFASVGINADTGREIFQ